MDADHRVRLAHHLISTSIFKKLVCPFLGSLQLYQTEQAPSSVFHKFFEVRSAGRGSIPPTPIPPRARHFMLPIPTPNFNPSNHQKTSEFPSGRTTYYKHLQKKFRRTAILKFKIEKEATTKRTKYTKATSHHPASIARPFFLWFDTPWRARA